MTRLIFALALVMMGCGNSVPVGDMGRIQCFSNENFCRDMKTGCEFINVGHGVAFIPGTCKTQAEAK